MQRFMKIFNAHSTGTVFDVDEIHYRPQIVKMPGHRTPRGDAASSSIAFWPRRRARAIILPFFSSSARRFVVIDLRVSKASAYHSASSYENSRLFPARDGRDGSGKRGRDAA